MKLGFKNLKRILFYFDKKSKTKTKTKSHEIK